MAAEIIAQPGWSFIQEPTKNSAVVTYRFQGPATGSDIEARLYGIKGTDQSKGYFADSDAYANYDGTEKAPSQVLTVASDNIYAVIIYDVENDQTLLQYLVFGNWTVTGIVPTPAEVDTSKSFAKDEDGNEVPFDHQAQADCDLRITFSHTSNPDQLRWGNLQPHGFNATMRHDVRKGFVEIIEVPAPGEHQPARDEPMNRIWGGIGGFLYIPSFPQLRRKETTWPFAT